ncbi:hypothetical protein RHODO2019_10950 [Rhodococcus antarcticus]|uniref:Uncharacterized protein n=1 Tax=Rhodococcus antarcticus TaxID=2987751 RepID=A0ABY6NWF5_9NOCA|nr:hypothetical protein [Rhodococcus antarcticus]UZJ23725.1 hypothetical protein RHODO2019_10950 [Rhodococcus antarcticus]
MSPAQRAVRAVKGDWAPGGKGWIIPLIIQLAIVEVATVRGFDYALGSSDAVQRLGRVERSMDLELWGLAFLAAVVLIVFGMVGRFYDPQIAGHLVLAGLYGGIGWGLMFDLQGNFLLDGIRTGNGLLVAGVIFHGAYAFGTASQKRRKKLAAEKARLGVGLWMT